SDAEMIVKKTLDHFKGLDILVNSAGFWLVDRPDRVDTLSEQDWDRVVNVNLTRQMGLEYARKGIRVNCIIPCNIKTPMLERELDASENREMAIKRYHLLMPLGRFGESEEVANAAVF